MVQEIKLAPFFNAKKQQKQGKVFELLICRKANKICMIIF